ncbi:MarR family winged helix-turn-helix transcriptional regulator [Bacillus sp. PS06]|uniref:MarR family winged helix-turn-helix transcriptional regulator n=1 Tax=Bacillus sp. PS06 TaxID=2764176 RepID=UPI001785A5E5|nr:MarR family transcriptional regulator [Bacillus sp. PS06]MBD8070835.1 MarR family transcriptional regulator [Bacillus sp. PS06]
MLSRNELIDEVEKQFRFSIRKMRQEINELFKNEITSNEFAILKFLAQSGPQIASSISKEFHVSASHITNVTDNLVKKQLISRERSLTDRRVVQIIITETGIDLVNRLEERKREFLHTRFNQLSDEELQQLITLFKRISAISE